MKRLFLSAILTCISCMLLAQAQQVNAEDGLALGGYDPVSYFEDGRPVLGSARLSTSYHGVVYRFASEIHREEFNKDPLSYLPEYGGWCAYAMGIDGERVEVDPETFKVKDGRLFLFYNRPFNNTLKKWNKKEDDLLRRADQNWKTKLKTSPNER